MDGGESKTTLANRELKNKSRPLDHIDRNSIEAFYNLLNGRAPGQVPGATIQQMSPQLKEIHDRAKDAMVDSIIIGHIRTAMTHISSIAGWIDKNPESWPDPKFADWLMTASESLSLAIAFDDGARKSH